MSGAGLVALILILSQFFLLSPSAKATTPVTFTSSSSTRFQVGVAGSFSVETSVSASVTLSATSLPSWLSLTDNGNGTGTLKGTPPAGSEGSHALTLVATVEGSASVSQSFTLYVDESPTITSADHTTFTVGASGSFTVTTTAGYPASTAITESGALPTGVSFTDHGNGTATLSGTPAAGTAGTYHLTIVATAVGGSGLHTSQGFTLTVDAPTPSVEFTSGASVVFLVGTEGRFSVTTTATCPVTLTAESLPAWLHLVDNGNGTGSLVGTPPAGSEGSYTFTLVATTQGGVTAHQTFTLWVKQQLAITSSDHVTFTVGTPGSFTVTTADVGATIVLTATGALPAGVTFTDNGNGTATLSGTPAAGTGGTYVVTIVASASGPYLSASQTFTLTVSSAPMFTSANHVTFTVGTAGSFTVTTSGSPAATICLSGALPSGVTFVDNGNGTATLSGTPAAGTGGAYTLLLTASNGVSPTAMQTFTLYVDEAPVITSSDHAAFSLGTAGSFMITTKPGFPQTTAITVTGLPAGLTFMDKGNGTGVISGTPAAGTAGTYHVKVVATAVGGSAPSTCQELTLTVAEGVVFTSENHVTFTLGVASSFTVTVSGCASNAILSATGTLPEGVGFTDNHNGTGTLAGTPSATGTFTVHITAQCGNAAAVVQDLALTVAPAAGQTGSAPGESLGTSNGLGSTELTSSTGLLARTGAAIDARLPLIAAVGLTLLGAALVAVGLRRRRQS